MEKFFFCAVSSEKRTSSICSSHIVTHRTSGPHFSRFSGPLHFSLTVLLVVGFCFKGFFNKNVYVK